MPPTAPMWTCEQIEAHLSDHVDRLLNPGERDAFEGHVAECARCQPQVARVAGFVSAMHRLEPLKAPPWLVASILEQTLGPRAEKRGWRAWLSWLRPVWQPRFAYGALTVILTFGVVFRTLGIRPTLADLHPANLYRAADRGLHLLYARGSKYFTDLRVVYEIQSRLRPEPEPQAAPEQAPSPGQAPGQSNTPPAKSPRELNRANDRDQALAALACMLHNLPGRSLR